MDKNVILFFADGTEEVEALVPFDMLKRCDANVVLCAVGEGRVRTGSHKLKIECDTSEKEIDLKMDFDMIVIPGGGLGSSNMAKSDVVDHFIKRALKEDKYISSICASPSVVLGPKGVLEGKKAVCYPGFEEGMKGAFSSESGVIKDGKIITAKGCGVSFEFSFEIVSCLFGDEKTEELKRKIIWSC